MSSEKVSGRQSPLRGELYLCSSYMRCVNRRCLAPSFVNSRPSPVVGIKWIPSRQLLSKRRCVVVSSNEREKSATQGQRRSLKQRSASNRRFLKKILKHPSNIGVIGALTLLSSLDFLLTLVDPTRVKPPVRPSRYDDQFEVAEEREDFILEEENEVFATSVFIENGLEAMDNTIEYENTFLNREKETQSSMKSQEVETVAESEMQYSSEMGIKDQIENKIENEVAEVKETVPSIEYTEEISKVEIDAAIEKTVEMIEGTKEISKVEIEAAIDETGQMIEDVEGKSKIEIESDTENTVETVEGAEEIVKVEIEAEIEKVVETVEGTEEIVKVEIEAEIENTVETIEGTEEKSEVEIEKVQKSIESDVATAIEDTKAEITETEATTVEEEIKSEVDIDVGKPVESAVRIAIETSEETLVETSETATVVTENENENQLGMETAIEKAVEEEVDAVIDSVVSDFLTEAEEEFRFQEDQTVSSSHEDIPDDSSVFSSDSLSIEVTPSEADSSEADIDSTVYPVEDCTSSGSDINVGETHQRLLTERGNEVETNEFVEREETNDEVERSEFDEEVMVSASPSTSQTKEKKRVPVRKNTSLFAPSIVRRHSHGGPGLADGGNGSSTDESDMSTEQTKETLSPMVQDDSEKIGDSKNYFLPAAIGIFLGFFALKYITGTVFTRTTVPTGPAIAEVLPEPTPEPTGSIYEEYEALDESELEMEFEEEEEEGEEREDGEEEEVVVEERFEEDESDEGVY